MKRLFAGAMLLVMAAVLPGCDVPRAALKIGQIIVDPDTPVGDAADQPTEIALHAFAAADANPNFEDEPAPVVIRIYALSSDHRLYGYDFFTLTEAPEEAFGVTLLQELDEQQIAPEDYKVFGPYELPRNTKHIGVIAEFFDIQSSDWRTSISVEDTGSDSRILLLILEEEVRLVREES